MAWPIFICPNTAPLELNKYTVPGYPSEINILSPNYRFLAVLGLTTAATLPVVGALLVFSLMVGPASAARSLSDRPVPALLLSAAIAIITIWISVALSYVSDWPVGFFVGASGVVCYALGRILPGAGRHPTK